MFKLAVILLGSFFFSSGTASAHEAYVLPTNFFWKSINGPASGDVLDTLKDPGNLQTTIIIASSILVLLILNFFFRKSAAGQRAHQAIERFAYLGPHFMRFSVAAAFFFSAIGNTFLGPELFGTMFSNPHLIQILLFVISIMIAFGFLTELAALIGIVIFITGSFVYGSYILTYLNYLGELLVLFFFGMRTFSIDKYLFGPLERFKKFREYEMLIIRIFYGTSLIFAAITVKLMHPELTLAVVNDWNLTQFGWLFPSDPHLVTLGAGIVEVLIGLFILVGFQMRLTVLISLFYITLSLLYFREMVWPHLLLYGISFALLVQPERFSLDNLLFKKNKKKDSLG